MLVVSIFAVTVTGCGEKSEVATEQEVSNQEDSLKQAEEVAQDTAEGKNSMYVFEDSDDGNLAAITFLGYGDQEKEKNFATFCEQYQLDAEKFVEVVDVEDCEWYAIIPKYTKEELTISHVDMNEGGELEKTEELLITKEPVLICCNISDIVPSVDVTITYNDQEVSINPFISLENGELSEYEGLFEISLQQN